MQEIDHKNIIVREVEIDPEKEIARLKELSRDIRRFEMQPSGEVLKRANEPKSSEDESGIEIDRGVKLELPALDERRIQNILDSLIRLDTNKIKKIVIYRKGPILEE